MSDRHAGDAGAPGGGGRPPSSGRSIINVTDLWVAVAILGVVAVLWYHTTLWDPLPAFVQRGLAPSLFPRIWLGLMAVMALFLPFEQYLQGAHGAALDKDRSKPVKTIAYVTMLLMVPLCASMEWLGSIAVIFLICIVLPLLWGERRFRIIVPFAVIFPPAIYFLFKLAFKVNFEPGVLGIGIK